MTWLLIIGGIALVFWLASQGRKAKQRAAVDGLRDHFPPIARMHLVAACPGLDPVLKETELRLLFDWILIQLYRRTGSSGFGDLMRWSVEHGPAEATSLTADISLEAVERLPQPVLAVIDGCQGRAVAAVLIDQSLNEAGARVQPELDRKYV